MTHQISQVQRELDAIVYINSHRCSRMHYSTVFDIISESGLPYQLVQHCYDYSGRLLRNYRYSWTSDYNSDAALYIQETKAGRYQCISMGQAIDLLRMVLQDYLRSLKSNVVSNEN